MTVSFSVALRQFGNVSYGSILFICVDKQVHCLGLGFDNLYYEGFKVSVKNLYENMTTCLLTVHQGCCVPW